MKCLGDIHGLLPECAVSNEENFVGLDFGAELLDLLDQVGVDLQTTGGVKNYGVALGSFGRVECSAADGGYILGIAIGVKGQILLFGQNFELVDGSRSVDITGSHEGFVAAFFEEFAEFGRCGRFTGTVQTNHHNSEWSMIGDRSGALAQQFHQFVVDDLDDLLAGGN